MKYPRSGVLVHLRMVSFVINSLKMGTLIKATFLNTYEAYIATQTCFTAVQEDEYNICIY